MFDPKSLVMILNAKRLAGEKHDYMDVAIRSIGVIEKDVFFSPAGPTIVF